MPRLQHEAWTALFDNFPAQRILDRFQEFYNVFGADRKRTHAQFHHDQEWIRAKESRSKKKKAWDTLFAGLTLEEIIGQINEVWLDPDYELIIMSEKACRIVLGTKEE